MNRKINLLSATIMAILMKFLAFSGMVIHNGNVEKQPSGQSFETANIINKVNFNITTLQLSGFTTDETNSHWSGYVAATSFSNPQPNFQTVCGSWIVQSVSPSPQGNAAQWIGIGGFFSGRTLIQTGTDSESGPNGVSYCAWIELIPGKIYYPPLTIEPGNVISASIYLDEIGTNNWQVQLTDVTTGQTNTSQVFNFDSSMLSAEWIEENPNISPYSLADFGTAQFGPVFTHSTPDQAVVESGAPEYVAANFSYNPERVPLPPTYYIGQLANYKIDMVIGGTILASTSGLTGTNQCSFTVQWENS